MFPTLRDVGTSPRRRPQARASSLSTNRTTAPSSQSAPILEAGNRYVLWTPVLDAGTLSALGLEAGDTAAASDHLPVVADFALRSR